MEYYSKIVHGKELSNNQIFIATHSPYVMQGAKNACFYILESQKTENNKYKIVATKDGRFENWTPNQLSIEAFHLDNLYNGEASEKLNKLRGMIKEIELGDRLITDIQYETLEEEIRKLVRSDDSILLAADLLEFETQNH